MKRHVFQEGEDIEAIARQHGFLLPITIWNDPSNDALRELRKSAYSLAPGDVLSIPDLQIQAVDASDGRRHVFQLRGLIRPAFYSRLVPDADLPAARFAPVFSQPGAVGFDVSFAPHLGGALTHVAAAHDSAKFRAVVAGRGRLAEGPLLQSVGYLLMGNKQAWVADALARHDEADMRVLMTWIANVLGFPCDPGKPGDPSAQGFGHALRRLRSAADITHGTVLYKPDMEPRPEEDLGAIFDAIEGRLRAAANLSAEAMTQARAKIEFLSPAWVDLTPNDGIEGTGPAASLDLVLFDDQVVKATPGQVHPLLAKLSSFMYSSLETKETTTSFEKIKLDIVEFEDVHFAPKRSVFLPTELTAAGPDDEHWGITGADVLVAALQNARAHPKRVLLIRGHTDSTSTKAKNLVLSKKRAEGVKLMISGMDHAAEWAQHANAEGTLDDANEYLRWIDERFGFGCRPSVFDEPDPRKDAKALQAFRNRYNDVVEAARTTSFNPYRPAFREKLLVGPLSRHDWRAFFELMQRYLAEQQRMLIEDLIPDQRALNFKSVAVGCGESHPLNLEDRERKRLAMYPEEDLGESPSDRRVDLIFLDPDEFARIPDPMLCHETADAGACKPELCMLYDERFFEFRRLSAEPQRGKIEIIERRLWRNPRLFTEDTEEFRDEVSGDFTPILHEKVQILVRVTPPYTPFEGFLELRIGRRTNDDKKPMSIVATLPWRDPNTNSTIVTLDGPLDFIIEWDGHATEDVPREYSDRKICDEVQCKMVNIPMMEMEPGQRAKHGPYFIDRVTLFEKDENEVTRYVPDEDVQNEFAMVVQVVVDLWFSDPWQTSSSIHDPLNALGFGVTDGEETVPFVPSYIAAVVRRVAAHFPDAGVRFIGTVQKDTLSEGLRVLIDCSTFETDVNQPYSPATGLTEGVFRLDGDLRHGNLFLWYESFDRDQPKSSFFSGPSDKLPTQSSSRAKRSSDVETYSRFLLQDTVDDAKLDTCLSVFGGVGFPKDRRVVQATVVIGELSGDTTDHCYLVGSPNLPRMLDVDGGVTGQVTHLDEAYTTVSIVPSSGVIYLSSTDPTVVPPERAASIARALNAAAAYVAQITAHECGHLFGVACTTDDPPILMPDGSGAGAYTSQDSLGHDEMLTSNGLMVAGNLWPYDQLLGLGGPQRRLRPNQAAHLRVCAPRSAHFASSAADVVGVGAIRSVGS